MSLPGLLSGLGELIGAVKPPTQVDLADEKDPLYRAGYSNGYTDALIEVAELVEAELSDE